MLVFPCGTFRGSENRPPILQDRRADDRPVEERRPWNFWSRTSYGNALRNIAVEAVVELLFKKEEKANTSEILKIAEKKHFLIHCYNLWFWCNNCWPPFRRKARWRKVHILELLLQKWWKTCSHFGYVFVELGQLIYLASENSRVSNCITSLYDEFTWIVVFSQDFLALIA